MQWINKYWEAHYQGNYDPIARRKGSPSSTGNLSIKPVVSKPVSSAMASVQRKEPAAKPVTPRKMESVSSQSKLNQTITELNLTIDTLEKERDFYFCKLREIETLLHNDSLDRSSPLVQKIQEILYSTEEGFEAPAAMDSNLADETF